MKLHILVFLFIFGALPVFAQIEGTARQPFNPSADLQLMRVVPSCPAGVPVTVSGTRLVCSPVPTCAAGQSLAGDNGRFVCRSGSSLDLQMGYASGPNGSVTFPRPFASVPTVHVFIFRQTSHGPCRGFNNHHSTPAPQNITRNGFTFTGFSSSDGCNYHNLDMIHWIAFTN